MCTKPGLGTRTSREPGGPRSAFGRRRRGDVIPRRDRYPRPMKIAINAAASRGPALAWWLREFGFEPVLFEAAPAPRTGGYIVEFWGSGYDIAEKMGLLPGLLENAYAM